jgi:hypothetical protein
VNCCRRTPDGRHDLACVVDITPSDLNDLITAFYTEGPTRLHPRHIATLIHTPAVLIGKLGERQRELQEAGRKIAWAFERMRKT